MQEEICKTKKYAAIVKMIVLSSYDDHVLCRLTIMTEQVILGLTWHLLFVLQKVNGAKSKWTGNLTALLHKYGTAHEHDGEES